MIDKIPGFDISSDLELGTLAAQSAIANQVALNFNEQIKHSTAYKGQLKPALNAVNRILIKAELKEYDKLFENAEEACVVNYNSFERMCEKIASLGVHHSDNVSDFVDAFIKDPMSIAGIVNKINRK